MHIISYRLPVRITSDCNLNVSWRTKEKNSMNNGATTLISTISTGKTKPNCNFCFSEVEGFDVHRLFEDRGSRIEDRGSRIASILVLALLLSSV